MTLHSRVGFEIELVAPVGLSRRTLADELVRGFGGSVKTVWHPDSEPSLVPGLGRFLNLTLGFAVTDAHGQPVCLLVDDVTLNADLDAAAPPVAGWHRVLTDDIRLLRLLALHCDPAAPVGGALSGVARLWHGEVEQLQDVWRLADAAGSPIALASRQGGQRERGCEIVTPPLSGDHEAGLEKLLGPARALGFVVPVEGAVHLHVDGAPFRNAAALANVVRLFAHWREPLRSVLRTNAECRRLAPLPGELVAAADAGATWEVLREAADRGGLTKFFDVNLTALFNDRPLRDTLEIRILPSTVSAGEIVAGARLVERLLDRCLQPEPIPLPPTALSDAVTWLVAGHLA